MNTRPLKKKQSPDLDPEKSSSVRINTLLDKTNKENEPPKLRKRKRNEDNAAFNPKHANKKRKTTAASAASNKNVITMRTENAMTVEIDGEERPLKMSAIANEKVMPPEAIKLFNKQIKEIPCNTPIKEVNERSDNGSPLVVTSKRSGTRLVRKASFNCFSMFTNEEKLPVLNPTHPNATQSSIEQDHPFFQSKEYKAIKKFFESIKEQTITVDSGVFKKSESERRKANFSRKIQQNAIMAESGKNSDGSATKYAQAMELFLPNISWNWAHLISHCIAASASQTPLNLVATTEFANTDMMFIEAQLQYLAKAYPEGFNIHIKANLMRCEKSSKKNEHLQVATTIEYTITTPYYPLPFIFNAQNTEKPHILFAKYFAAFVKAMVEHHKKIEMDENLEALTLDSPVNSKPLKSAKKPIR